MVKHEIFYDVLFESIYNLITVYNTINIIFETIISDTEHSLIN